MEVIELWRHLKEANYECVSEAEWLMILVSDDSKVIVDLSMPPTPRTPPPSGGLCMANDVLEESDTILE
jgi:hypothetical protein